MGSFVAQLTFHIIPRVVDYLKAKWGLHTAWQVVVIFVVFAITGTLSVRVGAPVLEWCGVDREHMSPWLYWPLRLLIIFPIYQVLLILVGSLFGQFRFFYLVEKKMLGRMLPFLFQSKESDVA